MIKLLMKLCKFNFGEFEEQEFRKFFRLGFIYFMVVWIYWIIRPLKDAVFVQFVDKVDIPWAKTVSLLLMVPFVAVYTRMVSMYPREKLTKMIPVFYGCALLVFAVLIHLVESGTYTEQIGKWIIGYTWYFFVESWASVVFAMFWAICTDVTDPKTAKRGFPLIYFVGQVAGIIAPYGIAGLPEKLGLQTDLFPLIIAGLSAFAMVSVTKYFFKVTPNELLVAFEGEEEKKRAAKSKDAKGKKPGFTEGIKLLFSHKYLLSIFSVILMFELITTIFDYNFKMKASEMYTGVRLSGYLGFYGSIVNTVTVAFLLLGVNNVTKVLGVGTALVCLPVLLGGALFGFLAMDSLEFLLWLMVSAKALNYALNNPTLKQLYIPTSESARFKAQAWIEAFGGRIAKETGSIFNMTLKPLQTAFGEVAGKAHYLTLTGVIGYPLIAVWIVLGVYLGKTWKKAVDEKRVVC
jgi:AAA family ATP:ADP antiporter